MKSNKNSTRHTVKSNGSGKIRVTVRYPARLPESVRQRKINRIYDILAAKI